MSIKSSKNGIGMADIIIQIPIKMLRQNVYLDWYPPSLLFTIPLNIAPIIGAVRHVVIKATAISPFCAPIIT